MINSICKLLILLWLSFFSVLAVGQTKGSKEQSQEKAGEKVSPLPPKPVGIEPLLSLCPLR